MVLAISDRAQNLLGAIVVRPTGHSTVTVPAHVFSCFEYRLHLITWGKWAYDTILFLGWTEGSLLFWGPRIGALSFISRRKHTARKRKEKTYPGKTYWWKGHLSTHLGSIFSIDWFQLKFMRQWDFVSKTQPPFRRPRQILLLYLMNTSYQHDAIFFGKKEKPLYAQVTFQILLLQLYSINPSTVLLYM